MMSTRELSGEPGQAPYRLGAGQARPAQALIGPADDRDSLKVMSRDRGRLLDLASQSCIEFLQFTFQLVRKIKFPAVSQ